MRRYIAGAPARARAAAMPLDSRGLIGPSDVREGCRALTAQVEVWGDRFKAALRGRHPVPTADPWGNGESTAAPHDGCCLVCRTRATPTEVALEVLPLYEPLAYREAQRALMDELLARADSTCLTYELDGGLVSLLVYRNLATRALEMAIRRGEISLVGS